MPNYNCNKTKTRLLKKSKETKQFSLYHSLRYFNVAAIIAFKSIRIYIFVFFTRGVLVRVFWFWFFKFSHSLTAKQIFVLKQACSPGPPALLYVHISWCLVTFLGGFHSKLLFRILKLCDNYYSKRNKCNWIGLCCMRI